MTRVRVLHVITRLEPGGAQRNTLYTVEHLDRAGFCAALAWGPGGPLDSVAAGLDDVELCRVGALIRPVRPVCDLRAVAGLRAFMRTFAPDVVHTHSSKAGILGRLAARLEGVAVVVHSIHGFGFTPLQRWPVRAAFLAAERRAARWTDHFVAVSDANRRQGLRLGLFRDDQVSVIRSGVALERYRSAAKSPELRRELGVPDAAPLVVQVGNFKPQKAPLDFVRVAAEIAGRRPEVHFIMPGDGPLRTAAEALGRELGLADRLHCCGWLADVVGLLAETTVSVLTSRHEGLPRALVESLAAGVPVVATAVDGSPEVVRDGVNGFLVAPGDVAGAAERVLRILGSADLRQQLSEAAPAGLEAFDIDLMVRQQEELYRWQLGRTRS